MSDLKSLLLRDKFAKKVWLERGLNPSDKALCKSLQQELNFTIEGILKLQLDSVDQDKSIFLQTALSVFDKYQLDTEEKELIADYFAVIATLINLDIREILNVWLYGFKIDPRFKPKTITVLETILHNCTNCKELLKIEIVRKRDNVPALWEIVQCDNCDGFNLLSIPENTDIFKNGSFFVFEVLKQNEHLFKNALDKMAFYKEANSN